MLVLLCLTPPESGQREPAPPSLCNRGRGDRRAAADPKRGKLLNTIRLTPSFATSFLVVTGEEPSLQQGDFGLLDRN